MSYAENLRNLGNINCLLSSMNTFLWQLDNGVKTQYATMNLFGNLANGIVRNEWAYGMQLHGNSAGNVINMFSGYGNPVSNTVGTLGLMSCSPCMFFNAMPYCMPTYGMYLGYSPMMGMGLFC
jgi:hypothetical protein